ncbi:MAG TPA: hypothetical protein ENK85_06820 [Saprospiraceae bacterium]|nr:hypothetical protein [Saprospiraceae bacterium]
MAKNKEFWKKPEGVTGAIFLAGLVAGLGFLALKVLPPLVVILQSTLYLALLAGLVGLVFYMALDSRARSLVSNAYMSVMRYITGIFVKMDPISILRGYLDDLAENINELSGQIGKLRGEMRSLNEIIDKNTAEINKNLLLAEKARANGDKKSLIIASRKAGRLKESNAKYGVLEKQMKHLYKILTRMYEHSEVLHEDTQDQVAIKEAEYKAIRASRRAMEGAKNVISGSSKKELFDRSMQAILDDVSQKTGEMERFMDLSKNFMDTMDLQNAEFETEGLELLDNFESALLKDTPLDLNKKPERVQEKLPREEDGNIYDELF